MNEVEKMYENTGIKPTKNWQSCLNCELKTETHYDEWGEEYLTCNKLEMPEKCSDAKEYYPLFTAEKQIELIKYFSNNYNISINKDNNIFRFLFINKDGIHNFYTSGVDFAEQLALFVTSRYKNQILTEEERKQIKEILE